MVVSGDVTGRGEVNGEQQHHRRTAAAAARGNWYSVWYSVMCDDRRSEKTKGGESGVGVRGPAPSSGVSHVGVWCIPKSRIKERGRRSGIGVVSMVVNDDVTV